MMVLTRFQQGLRQRRYLRQARAAIARAERRLARRSACRPGSWLQALIGRAIALMQRRPA